MILLLFGKTDGCDCGRLINEIRDYIGDSRISLEYLDKILQKKHETSKAESLLGMYLITKGLRELNVCRAEFSRTELGRPVLTAVGKTLTCSVSHKSGFAVACVSDCGEPLGVDVELPCDEARAVELARRFFSKAEWEQFVNASDKPTEFAQMWTRKEALSKLQGTGFDKSIAEFDISDEYAASLDLAYNTFNIDNFTITVLTDVNAECNGYM